MAENDLYRHFKILFFGDPLSGKREFIESCGKVFEDYYSLTIGVEFYAIKILFKGKLVVLQIWNIRSKKQFRFLVPTYCLGANGALLIYDIAKSETLDSLVKYIPIIQEKAGDIPIILIGNQADIKANREVSKEDGKAIAKKYNLSGFMEITSRKKEDINKVFEVLTGLFFD